MKLLGAQYANMAAPVWQHSACDTQLSLRVHVHQAKTRDAHHNVRHVLVDHLHRGKVKLTRTLEHGIVCMDTHLNAPELVQFGELIWHIARDLLGVMCHRPHNIMAAMLSIRMMFEINVHGGINFVT